MNYSLIAAASQLHNYAITVIQIKDYLQRDSSLDKY